MNNLSYALFSKFCSQTQLQYEDLEELHSKGIEPLMNDVRFDLTDALNGALHSKKMDHISILIESVRRDYLLKVGGEPLYHLLLMTGLDFCQAQTSAIDADLMWNVRQVMDIWLHQSHHVPERVETDRLFFELCCELLDPRFRKMEQTDEFGFYGLCIYFVMRTDGLFKRNTEQLRELQPRIQTIIDNRYGRDHHFSQHWIKLFDQL